MVKLKRQKMLLTILSVLLLLPLIPLLFVLVPAPAPGAILVTLVVWLVLNGVVGYVGCRRGRLSISILGPAALIAAGLLYTILTNPYGGLRSGPPGYYFEWWGLMLYIPMATGAYGASFAMAAMGMRIEEDRDRCRTCDYLLTGLAEPRCPECGTAFEPSE